MAEVDTSIYAPRPQQNPLDTITGIGRAADTLGNLAVGQSVQGAMGQDGQIDQNMLARLLNQSPAGAMKAIPTLHALQQLKAAGFETDQKGLETFQKRMAITNHLFSSLASKDNPTIDDVHEIAARALDPALEAHKYGITMPVIMNALKSFRGPDGKPLSSDQIKRKALEIQTQAASTAEILDAHHPRHEVVDQGGQLTVVPTGTKMNPAIGTAVPKGLPPGTTEYPSEGGAPRYRGEQPPVPGGGVVRPNGAPIVPSLPSRRPAAAPSMAGNPPGFNEATQGTAAASAAAANRLTESNDTAMGRLAILGNLEDLVRKFEPGKGADWTLVAKNFANRNLPVPKSWQESGGVFDLKSVASQEEFNKLAVQLAQQQFATIGGTGTDAKFGSAFETSPNAELSKMGNQNIIKLLKGNEDAIRAKNTAWQRYRRANGPQSYADFSQDFNDHFDPRAFQFKYMQGLSSDELKEQNKLKETKALSPDQKKRLNLLNEKNERQAYIDAMGNDEEKQEFLHNLSHARKQGWIRFEQPK